MADTWFIAKEWKARLVEFAGRRLLRNIANGETVTYDVSRSEGQVSQEGDAFNTKNMNDLEQRVANGFADAKTAVDTLSRDLRKISNLTESYDQYNGYALEKAISLIIDERLVSKGLQFVSISFNSNDVWFLMTARVEDNGRASGIVKEMFNATMYSMWRWEGADAVLKKLGNDSPNTITVNLIKGNGAKSLEGMRPVVLTKQENGQYAITSAPTSFGVRNERAEVDWGYNMGGVYIEQE